MKRIPPYRDISSDVLSQNIVIKFSELASERCVSLYDNANVPQREGQGIDHSTACVQLTVVTLLGEVRNRICSLKADTKHQYLFSLQKANSLSI